MSFLSRTPKPVHFAIPKLTDSSDTLQSQLIRRGELQVAARVLREEASAIVSRLQTSTPHAGNEQQARVAELLGGPKIDAVGPDRQRLAVIRRQLSDFEAAENALNGAIDAERRRASTVVCDAARDQHNSIVIEICGKLREVQKLNLEYHAFVAALQDDGVSLSTLPTMDSAFLSHPHGHPKDKYNLMSHFFEQARKHRIISNDDIPPELRHV